MPDALRSELCLQSTAPGRSDAAEALQHWQQDQTAEEGNHAARAGGGPPGQLLLQQEQAAINQQDGRATEMAALGEEVVAALVGREVQS